MAEKKGNKGERWEDGRDGKCWGDFLGEPPLKEFFTSHFTGADNSSLLTQETPESGSVHVGMNDQLPLCFPVFLAFWYYRRRHAINHCPSLVV